MKHYNINLLDTATNVLKISQSLYSELEFKHIRYTNIRFGYRVAEVQIEIDDSLDNNEIILSKEAADKLRLPKECKYNLLVKDNEIIIGPFIGLYVGRSERVLLKKLRFLNSFVLKYNEINGVIFAFSLDNINKAELLIDGYYYNPVQDIWEKATLPYPTAIFKQNPLPLEWREYFGTFYLKNIFNYNTFDKWEIYDRLKQFSSVLDLLPETEKYLNQDNLVEFLNKHKNIYIKPINGKMGKGIFNIRKETMNILVKTREKEGNIEWVFQDENEFSLFMGTKLEASNYIMQKTIDIHINEKSLDFRVGMDKNHDGKWQNFMFVSRVSGENSIVSNRTVSGGEIQSVSDVLSNIYGYDDQKVKRYIEELVHKAKLVAELLENTGLTIGKLAFDFVIDADGKIWIIEINSRYPDDTLASKIGEKNIYFDIHHSNIMYTKLLAGFKQEEKEFQLYSPTVENSKSHVYKLTIAIPVKERKNYMNHIKQELLKMGYPEKVSVNKDINKVEVEFAGTRAALGGLIEKIKFGAEHRIKSIISVMRL